MAIALSIGMSLLLGGCFPFENTQGKDVETQEEKHAKEYYVPVQDYTGEGYALPNGERTDKIAKAHRSEIEAAVKKYFKEKYKTDVIVHNVVGAVDAASVYVESVGEPHFYTLAIVPIDVKNNNVILDKVWSEEGEVEGAIKSGIYRMVYDGKIKKLNEYLDNCISQNSIVGMRMEAVENISAGGYSTPYYFVAVADQPFDELYQIYINNPTINKVGLTNALSKNVVDPQNIRITINLFMKEKGVKPDKKIFDKIVSDIESMQDFPTGSYSIYLHDNNIDKETGIGSDKNKLSREFPDFIVKQ